MLALNNGLNFFHKQPDQFVSAYDNEVAIFIIHHYLQNNQIVKTCIGYYMKFYALRMFLCT